MIFNFIWWNINIWETCIIQWATSFQISKAWCYKNQAWEKYSVKMQGRPMGFNVTQCKVSSYGVRVYTATNYLEITPCSVLVQCPRINLQSQKKVIKTFLPFPTRYLCEAKFSSYTLNNIANRMNAETDVRIWLYSIKPDIKECKTLFFSLITVLENNFHKICTIYVTMKLVYCYFKIN